MPNTFPSSCDLKSSMAVLGDPWMLCDLSTSLALQVIFTAQREALFGHYIQVCNFKARINPNLISDSSHKIFPPFRSTMAEDL